MDATGVTKGIFRMFLMSALDVCGIKGRWKSSSKKINQELMIFVSFLNLSTKRKRKVITTR